MPRLIRDESGDVVGANVAALKLLRDAVRKVQAEQAQSLGICTNVHMYTHYRGVDGYDAIQFLVIGWEHARLTSSGVVEAYFVPHNLEYGLWYGPNGDMRRDCMAYILRRIETMLKAQEGTSA